MSQPAAHLSDVSAGFSVTVDVEMQSGSTISSVQSSSHPIAVTIGSISSTLPQFQEHSPQLASATLSIGTASLDKDFILQVMATNLANPVAILETHPNIPNHRALLMTLVPKFNLPLERPEIVFLCDRSGSMSGPKINNLKSALQLFLKSLPVGVKFNICSFGGRCSFLFPEGSRTYDNDSLNVAMRDVQRFQADYGGTEMLTPLQKTLRKRYRDMNLQIFVLTDGQVWDQGQVFNLINGENEQETGTVRVFTLGIGDGASHGLIEGLARAGNGFAQTVRDNEKMDKKVVRMLKAALTPHVKDYTMEIKYRKTATDTDDDFELVDRVTDSVVDAPDSLSSATREGRDEQQTTKPISLFDSSYDSDPAIKPEAGQDPLSHIPDVAPPKILQTPSRIPPMFPFSRTNVYLVLGPDTSDNTPETVVLRGTSRHGPLELTIPVTVAATPTGEMIHQLAARNAVRELEEGRGWIFQARGNDGKLLREKYQGRFSDMVQREAVRLGVQFQVGGKWCSFVAVEASADENTLRKLERAVPPNTDQYCDEFVSLGTRHSKAPLAPCISIDRSMQFETTTGTVCAQAQAPSLFGSISSSQSGQRARSDSGGLFATGAGLQREPLATGAYGPPSGLGPESRPAASLFGGRPAPQAYAPVLGAAAPVLPGALNSEASLYGRPRGLFTTSDAVESSRKKKTADTGLFSPHSNPDARELPLSLHRLSGASPFTTTEQCAMMSSSCCDFGSLQSGSDIPSDASSVQEEHDLSHSSEAPFEVENFDLSSQITPLMALVHFQTFAGFWKSSDSVRIFEVLGGKHLKSALVNILPKAGYTGISDDATVTVAVVAFLRQRLAAEKDSWELVVDKALSWLEAQPVFGAAVKAEQAISAMSALWGDAEMAEEINEMH